MNDMPDRAQFTAMEHGTQADWRIIGAHFGDFAKTLPARVLTHLKLLDGDYGGFPVDRLQHSLQTATRAHLDGRDEAYVVMALLHDIGDTLGTYNHPEIAAAMLRPFVTEELHWIANTHGVFQGYYFFHYIGAARDLREAYRGHPHFEACAEFCEKYDQAAFDPAFESAPLPFFEPMVGRVFSRPINSIYAKAAAEAGAGAGA